MKLGLKKMIKYFKHKRINKTFFEEDAFFGKGLL